jgi:hypothetical protein
VLAEFAIVVEQSIARSKFSSCRAQGRNANLQSARRMEFRIGEISAMCWLMVVHLSLPHWLPFANRAIDSRSISATVLSIS